MWWEVWASQVALVVKNLPANAGEIRFPGRGHDNPLEYSCLENPMDCRLQSITSYSQTQLKRLGTQATKSLVVKSPRGELVYLWYKEGPQLSFPILQSTVRRLSWWWRYQLFATQSVLFLRDSGQAEKKKRGKTDLLQEMHSQKPLQYLPSHFIAQNRTTCLPLRHIINKGTEVAMMDVPAYPTSGYFWKRRRVSAGN